MLGLLAGFLVVSMGGRAAKLFGFRAGDPLPAESGRAGWECLGSPSWKPHTRDHATRVSEADQQIVPIWTTWPPALGLRCPAWQIAPGAEQVPVACPAVGALIPSRRCPFAWMWPLPRLQCDWLWLPPWVRRPVRTAGTLLLQTRAAPLWHCPQEEGFRCVLSQTQVPFLSGAQCLSLAGGWKFPTLSLHFRCLLLKYQFLWL